MIAEEMHVIDKKLFPLANFIYDEIDKRIRGGENSIGFEIPLEDVAKYYPYNKPSSLKIVCGLGVSDGKMEYKEKGNLIVSLEYFYTEERIYIVARLVHELTHFVNDNEGGINPVFRKPNEKLNSLLYFLRDTECNSRCSELGFVLKNEKNKKELKEYDKITRFKKIEYLIKSFEESALNKEEIKLLKKFKTAYERYKKKIYKIYASY